ncbi:DUF6880 family protein [Paracoccus gahaiensis]|uniref:DUF6880 family protein n=1 Tax=Paracoccus gahaiensis TaxID=1706839 RepID=UPI003CCC63C2
MRRRRRRSGSVRVFLRSGRAGLPSTILKQSKRLLILPKLSSRRCRHRFFLDWPAHERVAREVLAWTNDLDGNSFRVLTKSAAALEPRYPLAVTLMRRAMVRDTMDGGNPRYTETKALICRLPVMRCIHQ